MAKKVIIYSTPTCTYCKMSKEYFTDHNVAFEEFNVATDLPAREEMFKKSGQMGVPVIDIDGTVTVGFNQEKLAELLGIKE